MTRSRLISLDVTAEIRFEYGDENFPPSNYHVGTISESEAELRVQGGRHVDRVVVARVQGAHRDEGHHGHGHYQHPRGDATQSTNRSRGMAFTHCPMVAVEPAVSALVKGTRMRLTWLSPRSTART